VNARCAAGETAHVGDLAGVQLDLGHRAVGPAGTFCAVNMGDTAKTAKARIAAMQATRMG
jgi:hypothetical protein